MKKISKLFGLYLFLFFIVLNFSACQKSNDSNNVNNVNDNQLLTSQQILEYAVNAVNESLSTGGSYFSSKVGEDYTYSQYSENVSLGLSLISEVSKNTQIEDGKWYKSQSFEVDIGKSDKILALKLTNETINNLVNLNLIIKFSIKGTDIAEKTKTYNLYNFDILYNTTTKDVFIDAVYEKSRDVEDLEYGNYSKSEYFKFSYNDEILTSSQFERKFDIADLENDMLINEGSIENYNFLKFNTKENNLITEINGFDYENVLKNSIINSIQEIMIDLSMLDLSLKNIETQEIECNEFMLKISDAENISQITN